MTGASRDLNQLLTGAVAGEVQRALSRDLREQVRNGRSIPVWAEPLLSELAARSDAAADMSAIGRGVARVSGMREGMEPVAKAAELVGRSERHVRRLASAGRVRHQRVGRRALLVDVESLRSVIEKRSA